MDLKISPTNKNLHDLASKTYEDWQLEEITNNSGSLTELNLAYPVECIRHLTVGYRVSYIGYGRVAVVLFDNTGAKIWGKVYDTALLKSNFEKIEVGQSLKVVKEMDPNGEYLFLYTGRNDEPKVSTHYTKDGYLYTIEYDASNTVLNVREELI